MIPVLLTNSTNSVQAKITPYGQVVVAPIAYDDVVFNELAEPNTAYNFFSPEGGKTVVITGLDALADKQVSSTVPATVVVYEASSPDTTTVDKVLYQTAMIQDLHIDLRMNLMVNKGKFVNAKTTDDDIHMNIFGYILDDGK